MLKDLLDPVLKLLPAYASQLVALLSAPKRLLAERDLAADRAMADALVFLGLSLLAVFVAQLPLMTDQKDLLTAFAPRAVITFLSFILSVGVLQLCWRIVGGAAPFRSMFVIACYVYGFAGLLFLVFALAADGSFRLLDATGYRQLQKGELESFTGAGFLTYASLMGLGVAVSSVWVFVAWGAFRRINAVSRAKSALALVLANSLGLVAVAMSALMGGVFQPVKDQDAADALPPEIVGHWIGRVKEGTTLKFDDYNFRATGWFSFVSAIGSVENNCIVKQSVVGWGRARYDGTRLRLAPHERNQTFDDSCSGKHTEEPLGADEEIYHYRMDSQPSGWSLCLDGRAETKCLLAAEPLR
jgi:hypothetical protein